MTTGTGRVVVFDIPSKRRVGATYPFSFSKNFFLTLQPFPVVVRVIGEGTFNEEKGRFCEAIDRKHL